MTKHRYMASAFCCLCFLGTAEPAHSDSLPAYVTVTPGQYLQIDFSFSSDPFSSSGGSIALEVNGGSVSEGASGSTVYLYHDGDLLGTYDSDQQNSYAAFEAEVSGYCCSATLTPELSEVFSGGSSQIDFFPTFDGSQNAFINFQISTLGAVQFNAPVIQPAYATFSAESTSPVPIPAALLLLLSGLGVLGMLPLADQRRGIL